MPRIDPVQLLNCLSVLLSPDGGIKGRDEAQRLAVLMTQFSKKLVSKCIYIQILKCTETELLGLFMGSGGWALVHTWLTESIVAKNWPLVKELLELLLLCPVDIERLKTNNCPKLVKELSKDGNFLAIKVLASKLVDQWLKSVKGEKVIPIKITDICKILTESSEVKCEADVKSENEIQVETKEEVMEDGMKCNNEASNDTSEEKSADDSSKQDTLPVLKISLKDGKQIVSKVEDIDSKSLEEHTSIENKDSKRSGRDKSKDRSTAKSSSSSSSRHSSKSHSSSSDKHKSSHRSSSSSSRHSSSKEGSKDKDRHSSHSSKSRSDSKSKKSGEKSSSSSSNSKEDRVKSTSDKKSKEKNKEEKSNRSKDDPTKTKDKSNDGKSSPPSIHKLGKIPKLGDVKKEKPSISIEVRKPDEPKPKTVKTFNSKFRKHGLEEEVKPPPSRASLLNKKPPPVLPPTVPIPKRPSPVHNETPPEKKLKTNENIEKPGAIKLIPPKPKPMILQESDMFMDALNNASVTNKKEPKKRKRRTSGSKDGNSTNEGSPPQTPTILNSPSSDSKSVPPRFYQDTLESEENKEKADSNETKSGDNETDESNEKMDITPHTLTVNGLKGVLCYHKKKGPKKSIKWKPESELVQIEYFELDETERVNVTKNFTDMKYLEQIKEREAFQKARNLINDDIMEEKTGWKPLIPIDLEGQIQVENGKNSKEKDIQAIRQKGTLQPLYFNKSMIPDSPLEPDPETHIYTEPSIIPLEDVTGNQDNISDFRNMPWPEPKGNAPPSNNASMPTMFPPINQFANGLPIAQFPGVPGFQAPVIAGEWQNGMAPMMNPMAPGPLAPGIMPPGNMPPGMIIPPAENMMMNPEMFGAPNMYPGPPEGFPMQPNMFPMDFNMGGPPGPDAFSGPGSFRGAMRGRGASHWRGKTNGNWDNSPRGRGAARGARKTVCIYFQRKGSCRQGDNCSFLHPGVNGPY